MVTELLDFQKVEQSAEQVRLQDIELPMLLRLQTNLFGRLFYFLEVKQLCYHLQQFIAVALRHIQKNTTLFTQVRIFRQINKRS